MRAFDILAELRRYGPGASSHPVPSRADADAYCRRLATTHYENFPLVSWLLPRDLHQAFFNVYAFCRWADDLGDETGGPEAALPALAWWRGELDACYAGAARHPVFVALGPTIAEFDLPREPFADLISAFEQDQTVREYETFDQLQDYCRRSADPVGRIVLHMFRSVSPQRIAWSDSICTGLQLANFWQDVARDADIGRCYLPREDRARFGYADADRQARRTNPEFLGLMQFEVERARQFLVSGLPLAADLPGRFQIDIDLFARGGLTILDRIEQIGCRVWDRRPVVTKWDALRLLAGAVLRRAGRACRLAPLSRMTPKSP